MTDKKVQDEFSLEEDDIFEEFDTDGTPCYGRARGTPCQTLETVITATKMKITTSHCIAATTLSGRPCSRAWHIFAMTARFTVHKPVHGSGWPLAPPWSLPRAPGYLRH